MFTKCKEIETKKIYHQLLFTRYHIQHLGLNVYSVPHDKTFLSSLHITIKTRSERTYRMWSTFYMYFIHRLKLRWSTVWKLECLLRPNRPDGVYRLWGVCMQAVKLAAATGYSRVEVGSDKCRASIPKANQFMLMNGLKFLKWLGVVISFATILVCMDFRSNALARYIKYACSASQHMFFTFWHTQWFYKK